MKLDRDVLNIQQFFGFAHREASLTRWQATR